ncbi:solute carrier family 2 member 9, like 1 [Denticeps clupeoides]|uniref:Solute carrier family 2, facilitated glucose transporter member 5 n=1 Tax=Denticeps clupeoides TaxID=299321 RepID=A0AAY4C0T2_9TELE|nr:solute carrier family 2, facilitated glucose transporter member 9-like [Denticeps clupeoides]
MESLLKQLTQGRALFFIIVLGIGGTFQTGYHVTAISSPSPFIKSFINSSLTGRFEVAEPETVRFIWSAVVGLYGLGGLFGSMGIKLMTGKLGRKKTLLWNDVISMAAAVVMFTSKSANSFEMILLSRFFFGFVAGLGQHVHIIYLGESSPKRIRGLVTLTSSTILSMGKLSGQVAGLNETLGSQDCWNILLCLAAFFSAAQLLALPFFPEAPRYLLIEKNNREECQQALRCLWGSGDHSKEIEEMLEEQVAIGSERSTGLLELLRDKRLRWQILTVLVLQISIQFCGISAISMFSYKIFQEAGIAEDKIRYVTLGVGMSEVLTSITCGFLIERVGRRVLLWGAFAGMSLIMSLLTITLHLQAFSTWLPYCSVVLIFLFVFFYCGGPAGVFPSLSHEIFIQSCRPAAFVFTGMLRWLGFSVVGFAFPFLIDHLKSFIFLLFACICLAAALYVFFVLPETKGKTLLEIAEEFDRIEVCRSPSSDDRCLQKQETRL